jgi:protein-tyrosine phosphatase
MARVACGLGFTKIVATPHYEEGMTEYYFPRYPEMIREEVERLNNTLLKEGIGIEIYPGSEVMLSPNVIEQYEKGKMITFGDQGTHLLVELPLNFQPLWVDDVIYELRLRGITPILAHPERYIYWQNRLEKIEEYINKGVQLQLNLGSLAGKYGKRVQKTAERINKELKIDYYGSDAHTEKGYEILSKLENFNT